MIVSVKEDKLWIFLQDEIIWRQKTLSDEDWNERMPQLWDNQAKLSKTDTSSATFDATDPPLQYLQQSISLWLLKPNCLVNSIKCETKNLLVNGPHCLQLSKLHKKKRTTPVVIACREDIMNTRHYVHSDIYELFPGHWHVKIYAIIDDYLDKIRQVSLVVRWWYCIKITPLGRVDDELIIG